MRGKSGPRKFQAIRVAQQSNFYVVRAEMAEVLHMASHAVKP
jgi:hypothetical protein